MTGPKVKSRRNSNSNSNSNKSNNKKSNNNSNKSNSNSNSNSRLGFLALAVAPDLGTPLWWRRLGDHARQGCAHGWTCVFVSTWMYCRKPHPNAANPQCHRGRHIGAAFLLVTFLYVGLPALRPSGRLRRSGALLRASWRLKKSDSANADRAKRRPGRSTGMDETRPRSQPTRVKPEKLDSGLRRNDEQS